jgi:endoglycosylceramidase
MRIRPTRAWLVYALISVLAVASLNAASAAAVRTRSRTPVRLHTAGGYFRDAQGRVVILRGMNIVDKGPAASAYRPTDAVGNGFTDKDARFLADSGFNFVRLGINWSQLVASRPKIPGRLTIDPRYLDKVVRVAKLLAAHRIYYMLDLHQDCFAEWPSWAIPWDRGAGQPTAVPSFPACQLVPNGITSADDNLFKNPGPDNPSLPGGSLAVIPVSEVWSDYREVWRQVAERFRTLDYLMGYDVINEPGSTRTWQCDIPTVGCADIDERIQAFEENAMAGIRSADPVSESNSAVNARAGIVNLEPEVLEGTSGAPTGLGDSPVTDPKVGFNFHVYCGTDSLSPSASPPKQCASLMAAAFDGTHGSGGAARNASHLTGADPGSAAVARRAGAQPAPLLMSEFGATIDPTVIADTLALADPRFVSWAYWTYKQFGGPDGVFENSAQEQCVCFDPNGRLQPSPRADILIRPYPQATAGAPVSFHYDAPRRTMTYRFRPTGDGRATTEIVVPAHWATRGYRAEVVNGRIVSPPDGLMLAIDATSSAPVTVTLQAR